MTRVHDVHGWWHGLLACWLAQPPAGLTEAMLTGCMHACWLAVFLRGQKPPWTNAPGLASA